MKVSESYPNRWLILLAMISIIVIDNVDATAINLALPDIVSSIHLSGKNVQWVINGYLISVGAFSVLGGKLGDLYGKRPAFLFGLVLFILASGIAGFAQAGWQIIAARILQGIGFAITYPMTILICTSIFPPQQRGTVMGVLVGLSGFSIAIGPITGGVLLTWFDWRTIFYLNIFFGMMALCITLKAYKEQFSAKPVLLKNYSTGLVLTIGLFYLIYLLNGFNGIEKDLTWSNGWPLLAVLSMLIIIFMSQKYIANPFLNPSIFLNRSYLYATLTRMCYQFIFLGVLFIFPLFFQNIKNYPALTASIMLLPLTVILGGVCLLTPYFMNRVGPYRLLFISSLLMIMVCMYFITSNGGKNDSYFIFGLALFGIGFALAFPALNLLAMSGHDEESSGQAAGLYYTNAAIAGASGVAVSVLVLNTQVNNYLSLVRDQFIPIEQKLHYSFTSVASGLVQNAYPTALPQELRHYLTDSYYYAFSKLFYLYASLAVVSFLITSMMLFCQKRIRAVKLDYTTH